MDQLYFEPKAVRDSEVEKIIYKGEKITSTVDIHNNIGVNRIHYLRSEQWIIYSSGRKGNIVDKHPEAVKLSQENEMNVLSYDYPGFGYSKGIPTEDSTIESLYNLLLLLLRIVDRKHIVLVGKEVGCGVVMGVVEKVNWTSSITLISPFCSLGELYLPRWMCFINKFDNYTRIKKCKCLVKILTNIYDDEIKPYHGIQLSKLSHVTITWTTS